MRINYIDHLFVKELPSSSSEARKMLALFRKKVCVCSGGGGGGYSSEPSAHPRLLPFFFFLRLFHNSCFLFFFVVAVGFWPSPKILFSSLIPLLKQIWCSLIILFFCPTEPCGACKQILHPFLQSFARVPVWYSSRDQELILHSTCTSWQKPFRRNYKRIDFGSEIINRYKIKTNSFWKVIFRILLRGP